MPNNACGNEKLYDMNVTFNIKLFLEVSSSIRINC